MILGAGQIASFNEHYFKLTPSRPPLQDILFTLQLELGRGGHIFKNAYTETQQCLQTESWIHQVCKFMSANHINISRLGKEVSTQRTHNACIMSHLSLEGDIKTSELRAINQGRMSKDIFFISNICNHQVNHLQQSEMDTVTAFNIIHDFIWNRKHHTTIAAQRT